MDHWAFDIPVETSAPGGRTTAYYIVDSESLLIDPAGETPELTAVLDEHGLDHIAVTHTHQDHVRGVESYAASYGATVWGRYGRGDRFERATGITPTDWFWDGTQIGPVRVIDTPGHAPDHVVFSMGSGAFSGDVAFASGSVFVGAPDGDMRAYLTSLRRLKECRFDALYPAHGTVITNPDETVTRLIEHRLDRERRVLMAIENGATTIDEIVTAAYEQNLSGMRSLARRAVDAHVEKLRIEGKVSTDEARGILTTDQ